MQLENIKAKDGASPREISSLLLWGIDLDERSCERLRVQTELTDVHVDPDTLLSLHRPF